MASLTKKDCFFWTASLSSPKMSRAVSDFKRCKVVKISCLSVSNKCNDLSSPCKIGNYIKACLQDPSLFLCDVHFNS